MSDVPDVVVPPRRRSRSLSHDLVESFSQKIHTQQLRPGDKLPTESALMQAYGVSRTVVREAISRLQAGGLVDTQHGIGTFVLAQSTESNFRLAPGDVATATDVLAVLELRISLETESAGLAAQRRSAEHLEAMRLALDLFEANVETGGDTVAPDVDFHLHIARATGNRYFVDVMSHLQTTLLPRARLNAARLPPAEQAAYLHRINQEHEHIYEAIARADVEGARAAMRMHLGNGRERQRRALEAAKVGLPGG
jgi:GntR family transcriptional regulator, transcriptional repressor for pyruvate dehydrogenase complex